MPRKRITATVVQKTALPSGQAQLDIFDTVKPGFGVRIGRRSRTYFVMVRALDKGVWKQRRVKLGTTEEMDLAEARAAADEAVASAAKGDDPADIYRQRSTALVEASRNTYAVVRDEFLAKYRGRQNRRPAQSTQREMTRVLGSELFNEWLERPVVKITRRDVLDALDVLVDRGAETMANRTLAYLKLFFGWALERGIVETDPTDRIKKPGAEVTRDRVLTVDELRFVWQASEDSGSLFGPIIKLLLLTGQRLNEVASLKWSEIDFDKAIWYLPGIRAKNRRDHVVPLSAPALAILEERKAERTALGMHSPFVFTTTEKTPFSGFSRAKARLDALVAKALHEDASDPAATLAMPPWRLHDLRRTVATHMAEDLRIPPHIIEAVLNHISGSKAGVAGVYNRALHLDERRTALDAWADYLLRIVGEIEAQNVVALVR
jgi:integrase